MNSTWFKRRLANSDEVEMLENYLKEFRDHLCKNAIEYSKGSCMVSRVLKMILDCFQQELTTRFRRLNDLNKKFGFLLDVRVLVKKDGD